MYGWSFCHLFSFLSSYCFVSNTKSSYYKFNGIVHYHENFHAKIDVPNLIDLNNTIHSLQSASFSIFQFFISFGFQLAHSSFVCLFVCIFSIISFFFFFCIRDKSTNYKESFCLFAIAKYFIFETQSFLIRHTQFYLLSLFFSGYFSFNLLLYKLVAVSELLNHGSFQMQTPLVFAFWKCLKRIPTKCLCIKCYKEFYSNTWFLGIRNIIFKVVCFLENNYLFLKIPYSCVCVFFPSTIKIMVNSFEFFSINVLIPSAWYIADTQKYYSCDKMNELMNKMVPSMQQYLFYNTILPFQALLIITRVLPKKWTT